MKYQLTISWLYPDLMSIYGDRGNIICLQKRCEWREISVRVRPITLGSDHKLLATCDLLFMGGAQDRQQTIVSKDLQNKKNVLKKLIEDGIPGLYICGGYQFLGKYYKEADGTTIEQLGVLDVYTENPGENTKRLIGNIAIELDSFISKEVRDLRRLSSKQGGPHVAIAPQDNNYSVIIGFENHGGRTRLGKSVKPLGRVLAGFGSNDEEGTEGAVYKNSIGSYLHGPILPKNPELADWLIAKALEKKYKKNIVLEKLDDSIAEKARQTVLKRLHLATE